jgi:hypothetical protein
MRLQVIVLLLYITVLALMVTYAIGGFGLGLAIVVGLATIMAVELGEAKHDEHRRAMLGRGHHYPAH